MQPLCQLWIKERGSSREEQKELLVTLKQPSNDWESEEQETDLLLSIKGVLLRLLSSDNSLYKEDVYNQRQEESVQQREARLW